VFFDVSINPTPLPISAMCPTKKNKSGVCLQGFLVTYWPLYLQMVALPPFSTTWAIAMRMTDLWPTLSYHNLSSCCNNKDMSQLLFFLSFLHNCLLEKVSTQRIGDIIALCQVCHYIKFSFK